MSNADCASLRDSAEIGELNIFSLLFWKSFLLLKISFLLIFWSLLTRNAYGCEAFGILNANLCINSHFFLYFSLLSGDFASETGSYLTAHTTTQSSRTEETVVHQKGAVSAGISSPIFNVLGLCRQ